MGNKIQKSKKKSKSATLKKVVDFLGVDLNKIVDGARSPRKKKVRSMRKKVS